MTLERFDDTNRYENITLDKESLFLAYFELDKLFTRDLKYTFEFNRIYDLLEKSTGYGFFRTLRKKELNKNDSKG